MTSIRTTDTYTNDSKQQCRLNNIATLTSSGLLDDDSRLICSWCELMGASGMDTLNALENANYLKPGGFTGVDFDQARIAQFQSQRPDLSWHSGDLFDILPKLNDVGVLNFDGYGNVDEDNDFNDLSGVIDLAVRSIKKYGAFVLFYNKSLDLVSRKKGKQRGESLRNHTKKICEALDLKHIRRNTVLNEEQMFPVGSEQLIDDGFVGQFGAYEIYKGKKGGMRMANLRIILR